MKIITFVTVTLVLVIIGVYFSINKSKSDFNSKSKDDVLVSDTNILLPNYSLQELVDNSEYIIIGKCISREDSKYAKTINPVSNEIYETISTDFNIDVISVLKGNLDTDKIVIRSDIGQVGNYKCVCQEQVDFYDDEQVLLFINEDTLSLDKCYRASYLICSKYDLISGEDYYNQYFDNAINLDEVISLLKK